MISSRWFSPVKPAELAEGNTAPDFQLADQSGTSHKLTDYRSGWLVIYFYPRDATPGCTTEACRLRDDYPALRALGVSIIGISLDDTDSHARFAKQHALPFTLLSDSGGTTSEAYGVLWSLGPVKFSRRQTFVIDPQGRIARIYRKVAPGRHSAQLIADIRQLKHRADDGQE